MLQRTTALNLPPLPARPLRVLIEDPGLIVVTWAHRLPPST